MQGDIIRATSGQIDRLVTHHRQAIPPEPPHDLLPTLSPEQQHLNPSKVPWTVARAASATVRHLHRHVRPIRPIIRSSVASQLPIDRARVPLQSPRDRTRPEASLPQRRDLRTFLRTPLMLVHPSLLSHLRLESKEPNSESSTPRVLCRSSRHRANLTTSGFTFYLQPLQETVRL